jgi:hypothetical protein
MIPEYASNQKLSSDHTWAYRSVLPAVVAGVLTAAFAGLFWIMFRSGMWLVCATFVILWAALVTLICGSMMRMKIVRVEGDQLVISGYRRTLWVPLSEVESVSQIVWMSHRPIRVRFRAATPYGRSITFVPPQRVALSLTEDEAVTRLRALTETSPSAAPAI